MTAGVRTGALGASLGLLLAGAAPLAARQAEGEGRAGPPVYLVVIASRLNVRAAPSLDARVVAVAARGERLCAVRYDGDWAEVRAPYTAGGPAPSRAGFVSRGFVSETRATPEQLRAMGCAVSGSPRPPGTG